MTKDELFGLTEEIRNTIEELEEDLFKVKNKSARLRVRKCSLKLEKLFKTYRKNSIKLEGEE